MSKETVFDSLSFDRNTHGPLKGKMKFVTDVAEELDAPQGENAGLCSSFMNDDAGARLQVSQCK